MVLAASHVSHHTIPAVRFVLHILPQLGILLGLGGNGARSAAWTALSMSVVIVLDHFQTSSIFFMRAYLLISMCVMVLPA